MVALDWLIVGLYILTSIVIGVWFTKRAARSAEDFFVAGRTLGWFVAGTSIVATTFSSDTPLFVAGMSRQSGISSNWFWWSAAIGQIATVFFFARLWRRTEVVTDLEFITKRYDHTRAASLLRIFKVFFEGIIVNCVVMASVTLSMAKITKSVLNLSDIPLFHIPVFGGITPTAILILILGVSVVLYSSLSGLYGVVYTDLFQFVLAMVGCIGLACVVYADASGGEGMMAKLSASPDFKAAMLNFFPNMTSFNLLSFTFIVYIFVGISGASSGGFYVQRLLATRSEKDSFLAFLWFNICHFVIRPWPWIIVGILSLYYFPNLEDPERSFPMMINLFLPVGLKGIMVSALLAAFMSTMSTQLNWGCSYIINDFYRPFVNRNSSAKHYIFVSRATMLLLTFIALVVTTKLSSILAAYKYLGVIMGGTGTVLIARWYWWRVNPYSEIAAMITSLVIGNLAEIFLPSTKTADLFAIRVSITIISAAIVWVIVTLLISKTPTRQTIAFYSKMKIGGPGWNKIKKITGIEPIAGEFRVNLIAWLACIAFLYSLLLGIGKFIFHKGFMGICYMVLTVISGYILKKSMGKMNFT